MKVQVRVGLFLCAATVFAALLAPSLYRLPHFGRYRGPYGNIVNSVTVPSRHITDMATAINFDIRGFDTLGEEYILFVAVAGLALLLRQRRDEHKESRNDLPPAGKQPGDAIQACGLALVGITHLFGWYIVLHAHLTPGGGFQGGAILGTASMLVFLTVGLRPFRQVAPRGLLEAAESLGAGGYALIGFGTLLASGVFLKNCLPLGKTGDLFSAGTVPLINFCVGLEVAGGFILMFQEFLEQTRESREGGRQ